MAVRTMSRGWARTHCDKCGHPHTEDRREPGRTTVSCDHARSRDPLFCEGFTEEGWEWPCQEHGLCGRAEEACVDRAQWGQPCCLFDENGNEVEEDVLDVTRIFSERRTQLPYSSVLAAMLVLGKLCVENEAVDHVTVRGNGGGAILDVAWS